MSKSDFVNTPQSKERFKHLFAALQDAVVEIEIIDDEPSVEDALEALAETALDMGYDLSVTSDGATALAGL